MKNSIWYRFSSEKDSYEITFDTIDISVRDIKQKIIRRRNMNKFPEEFDLIFYDEENPSIEIEDKDLIKPMKHLIVKRLPRYLKKSNFQKVIKPKDLMTNKNNENNVRRDELQQIKRYTEPLEKISKYLRKEIIHKQFKCKLCEKLDEDTYNNFIITLCCKETFCLNCYNKEEEICPFCKNNKKGYVKNEVESNLIKKLLDILEKKEEQEKLQKAQILMQNDIKNDNLNAGKNINQKNPENINQNTINFSNNSTINNQGVNQIQDPLISYQLQKQLIEGSQFFIIKSSNVENIQKSKNNSVWATTKSNSSRLNQAFNNGKVILIFSVSGNQIFKGYAIMTSYCAEMPSNLWQLENNIKLSGDFSVSWLCYCELPFIKTKHLNVNKSRDCTPLEQDIGYKLCELCYEQEKEELGVNPQRTRIEINDKYINKINEDISNNKNKQKQKMNNNTYNKPQQVNNEQNMLGSSNITNNNINNDQNQAPAPNPQPIYPSFQPMLYFPTQMYIPHQFPQIQQKTNPSMVIPMIVNPTQAQVQQKQENEKTEKEKENKKENKKKSRHSKKRSRSRDKSRSRSRNRNKSRSSRSRRSNSSSSDKSKGRSKFYKPHKYK